MPENLSAERAGLPAPAVADSLEGQVFAPHHAHVHNRKPCGAIEMQLEQT